MSDAKKTLDGAKSPADAIAAIMADDDCPSQIKDFIQDKCLEIMMIDMPKLLAVKQQGPVLPTEGRPTLSSIYSEAMEFAKQNHPDVDKAISATVKDVALNVAEAIDAGVKRILLADKYLNTQAHHELLSTHAKLVSVLENLKLNPEQEAWVEKNVGEEASA